MKVLLINPPDKNMLTTEVPTVVTEERGFNPPLGIMYAAACARKYSDHEIKILDALAEELNYEQIRKKIKKIDPDIIGITTMTFTLIDCLIVSKIAKEINKNIKIVWGGLHPNIFPNETINLKEVDYLVLGEGGIPFTNLLDNIENKEKLKQSKGLVFKDNNRIINTGQRELIKNLDEIPFPARDLTPYKKYSSLLAKRHPITTMITSRGCPYKCLFCDRPHLGKIFRARSAKNVVDEMEECVNMGINEFLIYDDTFTINRQRAIDICDEIEKRRLDIGWDIRTRVDTVDKVLLHKMKKAGCERIHYGVEAGNQEILNILRKGITLKQVENVFRITREAKIDILAYFMIGSPRETKETIMQSIKFAKKIKPDFVHFSITTPFPATDLYRLGLQKRLWKNDIWRGFAKNPTKDFRPPLWEENLNREQLIDMLILAYKRFYQRPTYIMKKLLKVRSFEEFRRKIKAGMKIFKM